MSMQFEPGAPLPTGFIPLCVPEIRGNETWIALLVTGVQPEDEVLISTITFIAPVNAIRYVGAYPVFVDAEPGYWQMEVQKAIDFIENECKWVDGELHDIATGRHSRSSGRYVPDRRCCA